MLRDGDGEKRNIVDPEEILEQVEDIYAGFEEKKGWLFTNYTLRVSTEKAVDALLQEGQRAFISQNRMMHYFTFRIVHILQGVLIYRTNKAFL